MKTLHIVRHGKSSWDLTGVSDFDRPLIEKGILNSYTMAQRLNDKFGKADLIISSPANRALHTAIIFARVLNLNFDKIQIIESLYECETSTIIDIIEGNSSDINNLVIVGHNPIFTNFANLYLPDYIDNIPTSGVVNLSFNTKKWNIINIAPIFSEIDFPKKE
jgi:phosphohistidine phosphatase